MKTKRYLEALEYARELHKDQKRKATEVPYFVHLIDVAGLVIRHGGTEDQAIAALLHDAIEDQGDKTSLGEIGARFGAKVAYTVGQCSKDKAIENWTERQEAYLAGLRKIHKDTRLIVLADKLSNLKDIVRDVAVFGDRVWDRFTLGKLAVNQYFDYAKIFEAWVDGKDEGLAKLEAEYINLISELPV